MCGWGKQAKRGHERDSRPSRKELHFWMKSERLKLEYIHQYVHIFSTLLFLVIFKSLSITHFVSLRVDVAR
jgi:hypothetical protein